MVFIYSNLALVVQDEIERVQTGLSRDKCNRIWIARTCLDVKKTITRPGKINHNNVSEAVSARAT